MSRSTFGALVVLGLAVAVGAQTISVAGTGFHRRLQVHLESVPSAPSVPLRIKFGRAYFVDPFEATEVAKATLRGATLAVPVRTRPERLDLEAPEFSALAAESPTAELLLHPAGTTVEFDLAMHARYPVPVPVPAASASKQGVQAHTGPFCIELSVGDSEFNQVCAESAWPIPRGDAALLPTLYWSTIVLMGAGCAAVVHALLR
uniref:Phosphatidylinositol-glycan biosynthesis class X protein n=1 Tax=Neobodo designis TaxID=312471 RepID=A0A7S1R4L4_NEODS